MVEKKLLIKNCITFCISSHSKMLNIAEGTLQIQLFNSGNAI